MCEYDYFGTGPRMDYLVARALNDSGLLHEMHTDVAVSGKTVARLSHVPGVRGLSGRAARRVVDGVDFEKVRSHPGLVVLSSMRRGRLAQEKATDRIDRLLVRMFRRVADMCLSPNVFGMQSSSLELFQGRATKVLEQFSPPLVSEAALLVEETQSFPGWLRSPRPLVLSSWAERMHHEWAAATVVWAPSQYVVDTCHSQGADPRKFRVLPYPVPQVPQRFRKMGWTARKGPLRVVFAGSLSLFKGVQYIFQALDGWPACRWIDLHFFGAPSLGPEGLRRLEQVGTVHGAVPYDRLLDEFSRADLLLFPSLSEGCALVTLQATATGLPVVATHESGAPSSAMFVQRRDVDGLRQALELVLEDPSILERLAAQSRAMAEKRTEARFRWDIADLARQQLAPAPVTL